MVPPGHSLVLAFPRKMFQTKQGPLCPGGPTPSPFLSRITSQKFSKTGSYNRSWLFRSENLDVMLLEKVSSCEPLLSWAAHSSLLSHGNQQLGHRAFCCAKCSHMPCSCEISDHLLHPTKARTEARAAGGQWWWGGEIVQARGAGRTWLEILGSFPGFLSASDPVTGWADRKCCSPPPPPIAGGRKGLT